MLAFYRTFFPNETTNDVCLLTNEDQIKKRIDSYKHQIESLISLPDLFVSVSELHTLLNDLRNDKLLAPSDKISLLATDFDGYRLLNCILNNTNDRHPLTLNLYLKLVIAIFDQGATLDEMSALVHLQSKTGWLTYPTHLNKCVADVGNKEDISLYLDLLNQLYDANYPADKIFKLIKIKRNNLKTLSMAIAKRGDNEINRRYLRLLIRLKADEIDISPLFTYTYDQSYAQNIMLYQSDEFCFSVLNANILSREECRRLADNNIYGKERIFAHICKLPLLSKRQALELAMDPSKPLGQFFYIKRGHNEPSLETGTLKLIREEYEKIKARRSHSSLVSHIQTHSLFAGAPLTKSRSEPGKNSLFSDQNRRSIKV